MAVSKKDTAAALLELHGQTYAEELGINLNRAAPSDLFQLLCAAILFSTRISAEIATEAVRALRRSGWRSASSMADATWRQRANVLNRAGYARYDESTSRMLGDTSSHLMKRWGGDLRKLREEADRDPKRERAMLKEAKGLGDVGVDIYFREAQLAWEELRPFADRRALAAAEKLELGKDAKALSRYAEGPRQFTRLIAALVRTELAKDHDEVRSAARKR